MKKIAMALSMLFIFSFAYADYNKAVSLFQKGEYKESLKEVADLLIVADDLKPNSPNYKLRFLAAHLHWKLGNGKSVIAHFKRCMDLKKTNPNPYIDLSLYYLETKQYSSAQNIANKGLKLFPKNSMLNFISGKVSIKRGNFWRAKILLEKANSLGLSSAPLYNSLGIALMNLKKYGEANTSFTIANDIDPLSVEILNNLAFSFEKLNKLKKAKKYYEKAKKLDRKNKVIIANLKRISKKIK